MGRQPASRQYQDGLPAERIVAAFRQALACAAAYEGATAPNPPVGCVLLDGDGNVLAVAAHQRAGGPHAEAAAIEICRQAGTLERIRAVVVTLEPCNHTGRTPPCSEAVLRTPAREIWIGARDPNPRVAGGGAGRLAAAGLSVGFISELDHPDARELDGLAARLIAPFAKHTRIGLPWITVKQALRADGGMIPPAGHKTFTSPKSLVLAHQLRKRAGAILTGSGTILADAPEFTVRRVEDFPERRRFLAILDRRGRVPAAYLDAVRARGLEPSIETSLDAALVRLGSLGVLEVLVEAGPELLGALLEAGLWDEHVIITGAAGSDGEDEISIRHRAPSGDVAG